MGISKRLKAAEHILKRGGHALMAADAAGVAVFLATVDSVSSPCGLGADYWGSPTLQVLDSLGAVLRGIMLVIATVWVAWVPGTASGGLQEEKARQWAAAIYVGLAMYLIVSTAVLAFLVNNLTCPDADALMKCTAQYWMVPRNYCSAQLAAEQCDVSDQHLGFTQMCVRLGRAPLVNGAFGAWVMRTVAVDLVRLALCAWAVGGHGDGEDSGDGGVGGGGGVGTVAQPSDRGSGGVGGDGNSNSDNLVRPPSTALHERDTLLHTAAADHQPLRDDVIRQSPHVRKRTAVSGFRIDF